MNNPTVEVMTDKHQTAVTVATPRAQSQDAANTLAMIERAVSSKNVDVEKMRALLDMKKEMMRDEQEVIFNDAMARVQAETPEVLKTSKNDHTKSKYAKLEAIDKAIRPVYSRHGFSLTFNTEQQEGGAIKVTCEVRHNAGFKKTYQLTGDLDMTGSGGKVNKTSLHGLGSTISYLRRYLTCMVFNIVVQDEDNDGNRVEAAPPAEKPRVTEEQMQMIVKALGGPGEKVAAFCAKHKLENIGRIRREDFDKALASAKRFASAAPDNTNNAKLFGDTDEQGNH